VFVVSKVASVSNGFDVVIEALFETEAEAAPCGVCVLLGGRPRFFEEADGERAGEALGETRGATVGTLSVAAAGTVVTVDRVRESTTGPFDAEAEVGTAADTVVLVEGTGAA